MNALELRLSKLRAKYGNDWRKAFEGPVQKPIPNYYNEAGDLLVDDLEECPLEYVGDTEEIISLGHRGWYADSYFDNVIKGAVMSYKKKGEIIYLAATKHSQCDFASVCMRERFDNKEDAARRADESAQREAESCLEYEAKDNAERMIEEKLEEYHEINKEIMQRKELYKKDLQNALEDKEKLWGEIERLRENFWTSVEK